MFPYVLQDQIALYAFSCPKDCGNSAFTTHPLEGGRAAEHLGKCGVEFQNEEDMVQQYAFQGIHLCLRPLIFRHLSDASMSCC